MKKNAIIVKAMVYVSKLLSNLEGLYYHKYSHSLEVMERCIYLGKKEKLSEDDIEILGLSGLFHDTGFIEQYNNNEYIGAKIARNYLTDIGYEDKKIDIIEKLILATQPSYKNPKNILEEIIKDSDLDNLGRDDFSEKGRKMKKELEENNNIKIEKKDWFNITLVLLNEHKYFTSTQKTERDGKKIENIKILEELISKIK